MVQMVRWIAMFCFGVLAQADTPPLQPVPHLDLPRYMGRWYEIAKFPNRFQKQCVSDASADYALAIDGRVRVLNQCLDRHGDWAHAVGQAQAKNQNTPAQLQVRFAPAWLSFLPWVWGDYWVIDLDAHYSLAAVSEPAKEYLWILSRTPTVDPARYAALLARLRAQGLDVDRLEVSPQPLATRNP